MFHHNTQKYNLTVVSLVDIISHDKPSYTGNCSNQSCLKQPVPSYFVLKFFLNLKFPV